MRWDLESVFPDTGVPSGEIVLFVTNSQTFAALAAAAGENFTAVRRFHTVTKPVFTSAFNLRRLPCTFHYSSSPLKSKKSGVPYQFACRCQTF